MLDIIRRRALQVLGGRVVGKVSQTVHIWRRLDALPTPPRAQEAAGKVAEVIAGQVPIGKPSASPSASPSSTSATASSGRVLGTSSSPQVTLAAAAAKAKDLVVLDFASTVVPATAAATGGGAAGGGAGAGSRAGGVASSVPEGVAEVDPDETVSFAVFGNRVLKAGAGVGSLVQLLRGFQRRGVIRVESTRINVGDFELWLGIVFDSNDKPVSVLVDMEYKPCCSVEQASLALQEFLYTLLPVQLHRDAKLPNVPFDAYGLGDEYSRHHSAVEYALSLYLARA